MELAFKDFFIFSSGRHLVYQSGTILAILVEEKLAFKDFSILSFGGHLVYRSGTILAILVGSHLDNIPVKFESYWPKGSGGDSI